MKLLLICALTIVLVSLYIDNTSGVPTATTEATGMWNKIKNAGKKAKDAVSDLAKKTKDKVVDLSKKGKEHVQKALGSKKTKNKGTSTAKPTTPAPKPEGSTNPSTSTLT